jgi:predicted MFS family arabinose efflux permease
MAPNYHLLLAARMITGIFGGVIGSIVFAITTDLFPLEARGRVMGFIQTAFASSQILGLPIGLFLANHWGWHMPFLMIVGVSLVAILLILKFLKPIDEHLKFRHGHSPLQSSKFRNPFQHFIETIKNKKYLQAFAATALLSTGGFMLMPFGSAFSVHNLGIDVQKLPFLYMATGLSSIFMGPLVGRASDAYGKFKIFFIGTCITIVMVIIYTHMGPTTLGMLMLVNILMFVGITSRMIPSQALMSAVPSPQNRGAFMSVNSSIQQFSGGLASLVAGMIVVVNPEGRLERFEVIGYIVIASSLITLYMMSLIHKRIHEKVD